MEWLSDISTILQLGVVGGLVFLALKFLPTAKAYLLSKINEREFFQKTKIDEKIVDAFGVGIANVGEQYVKGILERKKPGEKMSDEDKKYLREQATKQAKELLKSQGIELAREYTDDAIEALIRYLVDRGKGTPPPSTATPIDGSLRQ